MPKISIILPTFNGSKYIKKAIDTCLNQSFSNIELIVVIDGSQDNTNEIVESYSDPRILIIQNTHNLGLPESLNIGFRHASSEYITWTSDDNWYDVNAIKVMVEFLNGNPLIDFVYTDMWLVNEKDDSKSKFIVGDPSELRRYNCIGACFLYRHQVYEEIGDFNPKKKLVEDYDYWIRVSRKFTMKELHNPLYYYRMHSQSLTGLYGENRILRETYRLRKNYHILSQRDFLREMSALDFKEVFNNFQDHRYIPIIYQVPRGIIYDPAWIINRGVWVIWVKSLWFSFTNLFHQSRE